MREQGLEGGCPQLSLSLLEGKPHSSSENQEQRTSYFQGYYELNVLRPCLHAAGVTVGPEGCAPGSDT